MLRKLFDLITRFFTWLRRRRRIRPDTDPVKVNIGSGMSVTSGWFHVDASLNAFFSGCPTMVLKMMYKFSGSQMSCSQQEYIEKLRNHTFVHHRLEYGIPFQDETIDYLYSSHFLEHLFRDDAEKLLREAYRSLKSGGRIRICVPDLDYVLKLYHQGDKEKALTFFFHPSMRILGQHHYMYDFGLLKALLETVGFTNVERCSFQEGQTPDLEKMDNRPEQTLFVEARKSV